MALGRGLGELLGEIETAYQTNNTESQSEFLEIEISQIVVNPYQPRKIFNEEKLEELMHSIQKNGLLQPIVVTRNDAEYSQYIVVAGERRLRASKLAKLKTIKAVILDVDTKKLRELALIENIQRDDLNVIEIANSYAGLLNDYGITHEELGSMVSKKRSSISNILRLLTLSALSQKMLSEGKISLGHGKLMVGLCESDQKIIIDSIVGQKLSVREVEKLVKQIKNKTNVSQKVTPQKKTQFDFNSLSNLQESLLIRNLDVTIGSDYLKIKINSQEDIENISKAFENK